MSSNQKWFWVVAGSMVLLAVLMQVPQYLYQHSPEARGVLVHLNSDEYVYLSRVEEALSGRGEQSAEAIVGDPSPVGSQPALIERAIGTIFRPTGLRAATVLQIMDSITPPLILLALFVFFLLCGFEAWQAFAGALLFVVIEFYALGRPIHQRESFLLVLCALMGVMAGAKRHWIYGVLGGAILGLLVGIYFWSWSFAGAWLGLLFCLEGWEWIRSNRQHTRHLLLLMIFAAAGVLAALPFVLDLLHIKSNPLFAEAVFRSGIHPSHLPESIPYSILFFAMIAGVIGAWFTHPEQMKKHRYAVITVLAAFIVIHQEIVTGIVFNFVSHYIFCLILAAIVAVLLALSLCSHWLKLSAAAAIIYLCAVAYDGRWVLQQFIVDPSYFGEQHFATLLPVLDDLPRERILSDDMTSMFVAGSTKHDVVYSLYLKNVLMTNEEIAERHCLTMTALPPTLRDIEHQEWLIYPDANSAYHNDPSVRAKEITIMKAACDRVDRDPAAYLKKFGVDLVLWDEKRQPKWDLKRLKTPLTKMATGSGWGLWKVQSVL